MSFTPSSPLPPAASPPPVPPVVIEYGRGRYVGPSNGSNRLMLLCSAVLLTIVGLAIVATMVDVLIVTWPDFGYALVAVPVGLIASAFLLVAYTAGKLAVQNAGEVELPPEGSLARTRRRQNR